MEPQTNPTSLSQDIAPVGAPLLKWADTVKPELGLSQVGSRLVPIAKNIQSPKFVSGSSGWQLKSSGSSTLVQAAANISGTVTVSQGGTGAITLTGILKGTGTTAVTAVTPLAGGKVYYVADSSGGAVTRKLTFTDGILTAET